MYLSKANIEFVSHGISNLLLGEKTVRASAPKILNSFGKIGGNPWDALRASRILASKKPMSSLMVRGRGLEPPHLAAHPPQGCLSTNFNTRACIEIILTSHSFSTKNPLSGNLVFIILLNLFLLVFLSPLLSLLQRLLKQAQSSSFS